MRCVTRLWKKFGSASRLCRISRRAIRRLLPAEKLSWMDQHTECDLVIWEKTYNRLRREAGRQSLWKRVALRDASMGKCQDHRRLVQLPESHWNRKSRVRQVIPATWIVSERKISGMWRLPELSLNLLPSWESKFLSDHVPISTFCRYPY